MVVGHQAHPMQPPGGCESDATGHHARIPRTLPKIMEDYVGCRMCRLGLPEETCIAFCFDWHALHHDICVQWVCQQFSHTCKLQCLPKMFKHVQPKLLKHVETHWTNYSYQDSWNCVRPICFHHVLSIYILFFGAKNSQTAKPAPTSFNFGSGIA